MRSGRPKIENEKKKTERIPVNFTKSIADMIRKLAERNDQSYGSYVREATITRIKEDMWHKKTLM